MTPRVARLRSLAKINLSLKVLDRRPDGYHELRSVFQSISLGDRLDIAYTPGRRTKIAIDSTVNIEDNLVVRAAKAMLGEMRVAGEWEFRLDKRIPMGGGLGGGSSNAAAVLLAMPALAGKRVGMDALIRIGATLGSDVPFFLLGGTAIALGRGTELYPLPDVRLGAGMVVAPGIHVSTAEAYRCLGRELTSGDSSSILNTFQALAWDAVVGLGENDFESAVFQKHPQIGAIKDRLRRAGAKGALMSGSGSSVFGFFESAVDRDRALSSFDSEKVFPVSAVGRGRYRALWWRQLGEHLDGKQWPPLSRYAR